MMTPQSTAMPSLDPAFVPLLVEGFNSQERMPVARLFNEWWRFAADEVIEKYVADFHTDPELKRAFSERFMAEPVDFDALGRLPVGTLGRTYHHFVLDNNLTPNIAFGYKERHDQLEASGMLARMPEELQYAVLRGFQVHDLMHVVTGYPPISTGEISVLAFCLAQVRFPYFGMWMAVVTTQMTFLDPDMIRPMMGAIAEGYAAGRRAKNVQWLRFEEMMDRPVEEIRARYDIRTDPSIALAA